MRHIWAFLLLSASAVIVGCGQKGPLVHPDAHKSKPVTPGVPATTPPTDSTPPQDSPSAAPQS